MAVLNVTRNNYGLLVKTDEEVDSTESLIHNESTPDILLNRYIILRIHVMNRKLLHARNITCCKNVCIPTQIFCRSVTNGCDYVAKTETTDLIPRRGFKQSICIIYNRSPPTWFVSMLRYEFIRKSAFLYYTGYHLAPHKYGPMQSFPRICMFYASYKSYTKNRNSQRDKERILKTKGNLKLFILIPRRLIMIEFCRHVVCVSFNIHGCLQHTAKLRFRHGAPVQTAMKGLHIPELMCGELLQTYKTKE
jgi:hypothetical protein